MTTKLVVFAYALVLAWLLVLLVVVHRVGAQTLELPPRMPTVPSCAARLDCQQQRVLDLLDYRAYLEEELALAKALIAEVRRQLTECQESARAR